MGLTISHLKAKLGSFSLDIPGFEVQSGELLCLLGRSGSGKSTLLNAIAGFISSSGSVKIGEREVNRLPPEARQIGFLFQRSALFPHLNVRDNVAFGLSVRGHNKKWRREESDRWLSKLGLSDFGSRSIWQLSEGQAQRVSLARVMILNLPVLLLDEPFASLDRQTRKEMGGVVRSWVSEQRATAIMVTHHEDDPKDLDARVLTMSGGQLI